MTIVNNIAIKVVLLLIILTIPVILNASLAGVPFLLIEPGSRAGGMGQAFVGQADCTFATFWNPGAMAFNRRQQWGLQHSNWLRDMGIDDIYIEHLSWNQYMPDLDANLGVLFTFLTYGEMERTNEFGDPMGVFSSWEVAAAVSYGYQVNDNTGLGLSFKIIHSSLAPTDLDVGGFERKGNATSFAFDFGVLFRNAIANRVDIGINFQNIGPDITYINETQKDPLPMNFRAGFHYRIFENDFHRVTMNGDMNRLLAKRDDNVFKRMITSWYDRVWITDLQGNETFHPMNFINAIIFSGGVEYTYWNLLSLRAGYMHDKDGAIMGPSFGMGIQHTFPRFRAYFDFAMQQGGQLVDFNRTFTLGLEF